MLVHVEARDWPIFTTPRIMKHPPNIGVWLCYDVGFFGILRVGNSCSLLFVSTGMYIIPSWQDAFQVEHRCCGSFNKRFESQWKSKSCFITEKNMKRKTVLFLPTSHEQMSNGWRVFLMIRANVRNKVGRWFASKRRTKTLKKKNWNPTLG